jgi:hypothetical protein
VPVPASTISGSPSASARPTALAMARCSGRYA